MTLDWMQHFLGCPLPIRFLEFYGACVFYSLTLGMVGLEFYIQLGLDSLAFHALILGMVGF